MSDISSTADQRQNHTSLRYNRKEKESKYDRDRTDCDSSPSNSHRYHDQADYKQRHRQIH